ncbi:MAG: amidohydrolase/deacetylase family metallohydrolase [Bryobacteraceae bacterium]|nr:amidohydrolase/deacetylase family metallohydrolase [Bryobacteraceae bacterium]
MRFVLTLALFSAAGWSQTAYDLVLKGGHVIDPKNNIDGVMDVAVSGGKIAAVGPNLQGKTMVDAAGLYVTPGLVDLHTHVYFNAGNPDAWAGDNSVQPDAFSFRTGTTTMVDAGSAGWRNFEAFYAGVIARARTRVLAFINIAGLGMITDAVEQADFNAAEVARLARKYKDAVVGVKTAHYQKPDWESVDSAIQAGKLAGIPIMVDFGYFLKERPYWQLVTQRLRPGDITTHMYRAPVPYVDEDGKLYSYLNEARRRGVIFDVGHGGGSFVMRNAVPAVAQGFYPDSISTDLHTGSMNGAMIDMPTTMSKLLAMGMPLQKVIEASTWKPARVIQREELGHLTAGAVADVAVWNLMRGDFGFADAAGAGVKGNQRLFCELTLKDGRVVWDWNGRRAADYKTLDPTYGIRPGIDEIVPPK